MKILLSILILATSVLADSKVKFQPERIEITPANQAEHDITVKFSHFDKVTIEIPLTMKGGNLKSISLFRDFPDYINIPLVISEKGNQATTSFSLPTTLMSLCDIEIWYSGVKDKHDGVRLNVRLDKCLEQRAALDASINRTLESAIDSLKK